MELGFRGAPGCLGVHGYIQEEEERRWSNGGPTRVEGAPLPRSFLPCFLTHTPSLLDHVCGENHVPEGFHSVWTLFDIRFHRNPKIGKKNSNLGWASG